VSKSSPERQFPQALQADCSQNGRSRVFSFLTMRAQESGFVRA
jgi:hypothetical protein